MNLNFSDIPWGLVAPFIVLNLILVIVALIDCAKRPRVNGPKWLWTPIIILISFIGPISYFILGRRNQ